MICSTFQKVFKWFQGIREGQKIHKTKKKNNHQSNQTTVNSDFHNALKFTVKLFFGN